MTHTPPKHESEEELERILRFNCPASCDGKGTYAEDDGYGNSEPAQCQWCFEFGMPARKAIEETLKRAVRYGWEASAEGYNNEYAGTSSTNIEEVAGKLSDGYLSYLRGDSERHSEKYE